MVYLDLAEIPEVFDGAWLWSARRAAPAWFRRADYIGRADQPLDEAVRDQAERLVGVRPTGPIRVLTHLRYFGVAMNPVSFYYCFDPSGNAVETILAEVTNTPWNERHTYAITATPRTGVTDGPHHLDKAFHVSPFMGMEYQYEWQFDVPDEHLAVRMENRKDGATVFAATLSMARQEITAGSLRRALIRHPWMTARVGAAIYWQAARLWWKGVPFHKHPSKRIA